MTLDESRCERSKTLAEVEGADTGSIEAVVATGSINAVSAAKKRKTHKDLRKSIRQASVIAAR